MPESVGASLFRRSEKVPPSDIFSVLQCVSQFIISHCRFSFIVDDECPGTLPDNGTFLFFSVCLLWEFVWDMRICPAVCAGHLLYVSSVCAPSLC